MLKVLVQLLLLIILFSAANAQQLHIHSGAGVSATQLPFWTAKHLGIYAKYGLTSSWSRSAAAPAVCRR